MDRCGVSRRCDGGLLASGVGRRVARPRTDPDQGTWSQLARLPDGWRPRLPAVTAKTASASANAPCSGRSCAATHRICARDAASQQRSDPARSPWSPWRGPRDPHRCSRAPSWARWATEDRRSTGSDLHGGEPRPAPPRLTNRPRAHSRRVAPRLPGRGLQQAELQSSGGGRHWHRRLSPSFRTSRGDENVGPDSSGDPGLARAVASERA